MASTRSLRPVFESFLRPSNTRSSLAFSTCRACLFQQKQRRSLHRSAKTHSVPSPTPFVPDVATFLKLIGRGLSAHTAKFESWDKLFTLSSPELKELGIDPPRTRRYLLRWLQKFRKGEFGVGGDLQYVQDGVGEIRVVEVPSLPRNVDKQGDSTQITRHDLVSTSNNPGMTKIILNVPNGSTTYKLEQGQTTADLKKPKDFSLKDGHKIKAPHIELMKGTNGQGVRLKVVEGLWEDRRGKKVFGGERRRAETLHKMGVEEHRKTI